MEDKLNYGIDAPRANILLLVVSTASLGLLALLYGLGVPRPFGFPLLEITLGITAANCLFVSAYLRWYSKAGKMRQRDLLLNLIPWRGDETVLDVGCGRGLLLIGAAQRLSSGKAVGVDIWSWVDLSGNRPEATQENARRAGVADRVEVRDGDAQQLPFTDASFDVVVSSAVLHNISSRAGRRQALREIARVLKPGGRVALLDLRHTGDYVRVLRENGVPDARRVLAGWFFAPLFMVSSWGSVRFYRVIGKKALAA